MIKLKLLKNKHFHILAFFILILLVGCSTKKDRFFNREYHAMTTNFNILYNGDLAFQKGLEQINEAYQDNYWKVLPIEPIEINQDNYQALSLETENAPEATSKKSLSAFEAAEAKAVKGIQKHSMKIKSLERNRFIDDAYLLLGKSRYYSQRFVPALEAFSYVIKNYPDADLINETLVWKAKTNIRLQDETQALVALRRLLRKQNVSREVQEDIHTTLAIAYRQLDSVSAVIDHLEQAVTLGELPSKKARHLMILGQLYRQENRMNKSQQAFQSLTELSKAPYSYRLHAEIEKAKNYRVGTDASMLITQLVKLTENRDNRPYLDELFYQLAVLEGKRGNREAQVRYFIEATQAKNAKEFQKGYAYEALGNLYFDATDYAVAGAYYDSVLQVSKELNTKRIRNIKSRREGLETVLVLQEIAVRNDSLWTVISMSEAAQKSYFQSHIDSLQKKDAEEKEAIAFQKNLEQYEGLNSASVSRQPAIGSKGKWYFYNKQTLGFGAQEFKNVWGSRPFKDNWRWSDSAAIPQKNSREESKESPDEGVEEIPERYKVSFYLRQLPASEKEVDSISQLRNNTHYQLGLIYKEQFKQPYLASATLENLLLDAPKKPLVLGATYHLYKIYEEMGDAKASHYKNKVLKEFPTSVFAKLLSNTNISASASGRGLSPVERYNEIYAFYKSGVCEETVVEISEALRIFEGDAIVPKFLLLKAHALAQLQGKEAFLKALQDLVLNHANSVEAKKAKELIRKFK
ncbi:MAG: tetratricopeptide repeat protein [Flavicella sp.]|nr:tetratricopeptide repeat protein [Flavicella sp.]